MALSVALVSLCVTDSIFQENYLIETRQHKMPYKHIAAHLQKTELACRLHYHQLSFGTKRRRRGSSASSVRSICSTAGVEHATVPQRPLPNISPPESPENTSRGTTRHSSPQHPVPILPKPAAPQPVLPPANALRLITQDAERMEEYGRINKQRLSQIYDANRGPFWAAVAQQYGDGTNPGILEDVWRRTCANRYSNYPPTPPNRSPQSPLAHLTPSLEPPFGEGPLPSFFHPVNVPRTTQNTPLVPCRSSFAISSLLTENKEVRSPSSTAIKLES